MYMHLNTYKPTYLSLSVSFYKKNILAGKLSCWNYHLIRKKSKEKANSNKSNMPNYLHSSHSTMGSYDDLRWRNAPILKKNMIPKQSADRYLQWHGHIPPKMKFGESFIKIGQAVHEQMSTEGFDLLFNVTHLGFHNDQSFLTNSEKLYLRIITVKFGDYWFRGPWESGFNNHGPLIFWRPLKWLPPPPTHHSHTSYIYMYIACSTTPHKTA